MKVLSNQAIGPPKSPCQMFYYSALGPLPTWKQHSTQICAAEVFQISSFPVQLIDKEYAICLISVDEATTEAIGMGPGQG